MLSADGTHSDRNVAPGASDRLADDLTTLVSKAAAAVKTIHFSTVQTRFKPDHSPVTAADEAAQEIILEGLSRILPGVPVISEESDRPQPGEGLTAMFTLVDPLDGTREFLAGRDEFTVNVALVSEGIPVVGCIAAPALDQIWRGVVGRFAERLDLPAGEEVQAVRRRTLIRTRRMPENNIVIATSRSHPDPKTEQFTRQFPTSSRFQCGSSLKFCRIAEGRADIYPRLGPTHEWDIAAGHAIASAAGGAVTQPSGQALIYGQLAQDFLIPAFVAIGDLAAGKGVYAGLLRVEANRC